jgi:hypothetical protein
MYIYNTHILNATNVFVSLVTYTLRPQLIRVDALNTCFLLYSVVL